MKNNLLTLFVILFNTTIASAQSDLIKLQDKINKYPIDSAYLNINKKEKENFEKFWDVFQKIRNKESALNKVGGEVGFGFFGNDSEDENAFTINGGISVSQGIFPQEFEFSTLMNIQVEDGQFKENLSDLRVTYDRFLKSKNDFLWEGFAFINRRSDEFLGLNSRYEIGGGIIIAYWRKKLLKRERKDIKKFDTSSINLFIHKTDSTKVCYELEDCKGELVGLDANDVDNFSKAQKRIKNSIIKNKSPFRGGALIGLFYEAESISHSDSLDTNIGKRYYEEEFDATNKLRWEIRPTLDFKLSPYVKIKIRPYFIMPMPWEWTAEVNGKKKVDYRIDFPFSLQTNYKKMNIGFDYIFYYDNTPKSKLLAPLSPDNNPLYLTSNDNRHFYNMRVSYKF